MSADRDVNRVVRSWLHEERHEDADRVLGAVLDQVDTTPQRRTSRLARREFQMNKFVAIGLGAAAVVVALFIGAQIFGGTTPGGTPTETPSPSAKPPSEPAAGPQNFAEVPVGRLDSGAYVLTHVDPVAVTVTVPDGWEKNEPDFVIWSASDNKATLGFLSVDNVYIDPCQPELGLRDPAIGPAVDDLVAALYDVPGWTFSFATDVVVDGAVGKYLEVDSVTPSADCADETLLWQVHAGVGPQPPAPGPEDDFRVWILDANGTRLVITANSFPGVPGERVAELETIIDSIQIE